MTDTPKLLCIGHSHLSAVHQAHQDNFKGDGWNFDAAFMRLQAETYKPNIVEDGGEKALNPVIERHFKHRIKKYQPDAVAAFLMGNEMNAVVMLQHDEPFDFILPGDDEPPADGARIVPFAAMRALLEDRIEWNVARYLKMMRANYDGPILLTPPPPPIADASHIAAHPGAFGDLARKKGVSPAPLRRKVWRLYVEVLRGVVGDLDVTLAEPPAAAFDADGYFKSDYWHTDPTHGNPLYGRKVMEHVLSTLFNIEPERSAA